MDNIQSPAGTPSAVKKLGWLVALAILTVPYIVHSQTQEADTGDAGDAVESQFTDLRTLVVMPEKARQILQEDMLDHLATLNEINRYLSENDLIAAAEVAETGMGRSLLSKYQNEEMRPGRYMPKEMREIGWELHNAATRFSITARKGNLSQTLLAYHGITSTCVACHYSFRTR
jgi:hypothetical protein